MFHAQYTKEFKLHHYVLFSLFLFFLDPTLFKSLLFDLFPINVLDIFQLFDFFHFTVSIGVGDGDIALVTFTVPVNKTGVNPSVMTTCPLKLPLSPLPLK